MRIIGIDVGYTTGLGILHIHKTGEISIEYQASPSLKVLTVDRVIADVSDRVLLKLPRLLIVEFTVVTPQNPFYLPIISLEGGLRALLQKIRIEHPECLVKLVKPGTWKTTPAGKWQLPVKYETKHTADALRIAYWGWKFGNFPLAK